ncbi:MAG: hypothetical protein HY053_08635 [Proteobacteria bacterium]|nr:hypothetical protein [Pseudomonadota bacterium]
MDKILTTLYAPQAWFMALPPYLSYTVIGLIIMTLLGCAGFILARLGYKPLWALLLLVPTVNVIAVWVLAYRRFPRESL